MTSVNRIQRTSQTNDAPELHALDVEAVTEVFLGHGRRLSVLDDVLAALRRVHREYRLLSVQLALRFVDAVSVFNRHLCVE